MLNSSNPIKLLLLQKVVNSNKYSIFTNQFLVFKENFYKTENFEKAKKIYNEIGKKGKIFLWYAAKQNAKILIKEKKNVKALKDLTEAYNQLSDNNVYEKLMEYYRYYYKPNTNNN